MTWLTWRQFRTQAVSVGAAAALIVLALAVTGAQVRHAAHTDGSQFLSGLENRRLQNQLYLFGLAIYAVPAILGAFWGAPLIARELEAGTHRLVWTQSVGRNRWLASKLGLIGLAGLVTAAGLSLAVTWWAAPIDRAVGRGDGGGVFTNARISPVVFGARGLVPVAVAVFAVVLGVALGLLLRRSIAAMAVTIVVVVAVQVAVPLLVRPHLITPARTTVRITAANLDQLSGRPPSGSRPAVVDRIGVSLDRPGDWVLSNTTVDAGGRAVRPPSWVADCLPPPPTAPAADGATMPARPLLPPLMQACFTRLADQGYRQLVTYQPAGRFWALQWREGGLYLIVAALLAGFCFWRIRRDLV